MLLFGVLSYLLGLVRFYIPGIEGAVTDLRELPLLISLFYLSNPLFLIGISAITAMGTPAEGSILSTFIFHLVALIVSWYVYHYLKNRITNTIQLGLYWAIYIVFYYCVLLLPLLVLTNFLFGLNVEKGFISFYVDILISTRFELFGSATISSLYLVQFLTRSALRKHKENLELLVNERTKELGTANKELEALNMTKDKFFSIIAHDLRGPLNSIIVLSSMMLSKFDDYKRQEIREHLGLMGAGVENLGKLLENLLLWAQTQRGAIEFKCYLENIHNLTVVTEKELSQMLANKSISFVNEIPEHMEVLVDKSMILTVLRNLVTNAIKFTDTGGSIIIRAIKKEKGLIVSVTDTGVGMSYEKQQKLFDITEKTSTPGTNNEKGTGLGLILCKEFIEKHGGNIWAESQVNSGTTISFLIPNNDNIGNHQIELQA